MPSRESLIGTSTAIAGIFAAALAGAQDTVARQSAGTMDVIAVAPANVQWIGVKAENWKTESPSLEGKYVEFSGGGMATLLYVNRNESFSNTGWLLDSAGTTVGTVFFDQASDDVLRWMHNVTCNEGCHVFVRGIVFSKVNQPIVINGRTLPTDSTRPGVPSLRLIEASWESHAGALQAGAAALNMSATDPGARKPLLPQGAIPNADATAAWPTQGAATDTTETDTTAKKSGGLMGLLKSAGFKVKPGGFRKQGHAFKWGDPPMLETYYRNIRDTELYRVFANAAWNEGQNRWPRVALVIEEATAPGVEGGGPMLLYPKRGAYVRNRCWRLSARLWTDAATSKDIPSFNWCLTEMKRETPVGITNWGVAPKPGWVDENTGQHRTLGPNPPYEPLPGNGGTMVLVNDNADLGVLLGNILGEMGFEYTRVPDGRVWIVRVPGQLRSSF